MRRAQKTSGRMLWLFSLIVVLSMIGSSILLIVEYAQPEPSETRKAPRPPTATREEVYTPTLPPTAGPPPTPMPTATPSPTPVAARLEGRSWAYLELATKL